MPDVRHAGIVTADLAKSLIFWRDWLGFVVGTDTVESGSFIDGLFDVSGVHVRTVKLYAPNDARYFERLQRTRVSHHFRTPPAIELLCFTTPKVPVGAQGALMATGLTHVAVTVESVGDLGVPAKWNAERTARVAFVKDPNGVMVELVEERR